MKKLVALFLALGLLLACVPAMADEPTFDLLFIDEPIDIPLGEKAPIIDINFAGSMYDVFCFGGHNADDGGIAYSVDEALFGDTAWEFDTDCTDALNYWRDCCFQGYAFYAVGDFGMTAVDFYASYY